MNERFKFRNSGIKRYFHNLLLFATHKKYREEKEKMKGRKCDCEVGATSGCTDKV
jgi:hypothetical protein